MNPSLRSIRRCDLSLKKHLSGFLANSPCWWFRSTLTTSTSRCHHFGIRALDWRPSLMGAIFKQELLEFFNRPQLWLTVMAFGVFLVHIVAHLSIEEDDIRVAIYQTDADTAERSSTIIAAEAI